MPGDSPGFPAARIAPDGRSGRNPTGKRPALGPAPSQTLRRQTLPDENRTKRKQHFSIGYLDIIMAVGFPAHVAKLFVLPLLGAEWKWKGK